MTLPLPQYAKIKDNYCIAYFGNCKEYLVQLKLLRPIMERTFPGVVIFIACRDEATYLLNNEERILTKSQLQDRRHEFAYIRELLGDMKSHPVEEFMRESDISCGPISQAQISPSRCVLLPAGVLPTRSLSGDQIKRATDYIRSQGLEPAINGEVSSADWIVSVENEQLFQAGADGKKVTLIPTGFGENIFKSMYPNGQILKLPS